MDVSSVPLWNPEVVTAFHRADGQSIAGERSVTRTLIFGLSLAGVAVLTQPATAHYCYHPLHAHYYTHAHRSYHRVHYVRAERPYYRTTYETVYEPRPYWHGYYEPRPYWRGDYEPYSPGYAYEPHWNVGFYGGDWDDDDD
jgi:hypothetical protein